MSEKIYVSRIYVSYERIRRLAAQCNYSFDDLSSANAATIRSILNGENISSLKDFKSLFHYLLETNIPSDNTKNLGQWFFQQLRVQTSNGKELRDYLQKLKKEKSDDPKKEYTKDNIWEDYRQYNLLTAKDIGDFGFGYCFGMIKGFSEFFVTDNLEGAIAIVSLIVNANKEFYSRTYDTLESIVKNSANKILKTGSKIGSDYDIFKQELIKSLFNNIKNPDLNYSDSIQVVIDFCKKTRNILKEIINTPFDEINKTAQKIEDAFLDFLIKIDTKNLEHPLDGVVNKIRRDWILFNNKLDERLWSFKFLDAGYYAGLEITKLILNLALLVKQLVESFKLAYNYLKNLALTNKALFASLLLFANSISTDAEILWNPLIRERQGFFSILLEGYATKPKGTIALVLPIIVETEFFVMLEQKTALEYLKQNSPLKSDILNSKIPSNNYYKNYWVFEKSKGKTSKTIAGFLQVLKNSNKDPGLILHRQIINEFAELKSLEAEGFLRVYDKVPIEGQVKGQLLEEHLFNEISKWFKENNGAKIKELLGIEDISNVVFIPGHQISDANGRQLTDGIFGILKKNKSGINNAYTLEIIGILEAKSGNSVIGDLVSVPSTPSLINLIKKIKAEAIQVFTERNKIATLKKKPFNESIESITKELEKENANLTELKKVKMESKDYIGEGSPNEKLGNEKKFIMSEFGGQLRTNVERLYDSEIKIPINGQATLVNVEISPNKVKFLGGVPKGIDKKNFIEKAKESGFSLSFIEGEMTLEQLNKVEAKIISEKKIIDSVKDN